MLKKKNIWTPEEILRDPRHRKIIAAHLKRTLDREPSEDEITEWIKKHFFEKGILGEKPKKVRIVTLSYLMGTNPDFETATHWGHYYTQKYNHDYAVEKGYNIIWLDGDDDTRNNWEKAWAEHQGEIVYFDGLGHGNESQFAGQYNDILLFVGDPLKDNYAEVGFSLLSCETGVKLGPWLVEEAGAAMYHGYNDLFYFVIDEANWPNSYAKYFFEPGLGYFTFTQAMMDGHTAGEAYDGLLAAWERSYSEAPEICKPYILHDMGCDILLGDPDWRIPLKPVERIVEAHLYHSWNEADWIDDGPMSEEDGEWIGEFEADQIGSCWIKVWMRSETGAEGEGIIQVEVYKPKKKVIVEIIEPEEGSKIPVGTVSVRAVGRVVEE